MTLARLIKLAAIAFVLNGCAFMREDRIHYTWQPEDSAACEDCAPAAAGSDFIGVALSGGGARASVFGAAALQALAEEGVTLRMTHLSSVSGGGFPAAYYALNVRAPCSGLTASNAAICEREKYASFMEAMRHNYLSDLTKRQLFNPNRFSSPTRRLSSLQDALDAEIIHGASFGDLPPQPVLLINGARYDDARRFVFSNQAIPEEESEIAPFTEATLRTASFSMPGCTRAAPQEFPVALALAISAGFPPLLGPASLEMAQNCRGDGLQYWHLGDGGILDNTGVETLEDYALRGDRGAAPPVRRIFIFSVDAGRSTAPETMMRTRNLKLWTSDPGRVVDIVGKRAAAYRDVALAHVFERDGIEYRLFKMRYTDAQLDAWPASCGARDGGSEAIGAHLATIPTNFKITDCDADLMEAAARDVVSRTIEANRALLSGAGVIGD